MRPNTSLLALMLACLSSPLGAQEVRSAPEGHVPPPATIAGLDWLTGRWVGEGIGGATAQEVYSAPAGSSIAGHFVQEDGEGGIAFFEILQIAEENGSLVYRLKHFGPDLTGWEEKDEMERFPLVALEDGALYFDGLTVRRDGADGLLAAVLVREDDGSVEEYVFRYRRAD
jgi:hypothetical protein